MALVTGGLGGLGLIASRELVVTGGADKLVAVSRSGRTAGRLFEEELVETLQEYAVHQIIRCDLADCGAVVDALKFADGGQGVPKPRAPPGVDPEAFNSYVKSLDAFALLRSIISCLREVRREGVGGQIGVERMRRAVRFRDNVAAAVEESEKALAGRQAGPGRRGRLADYKARLAELTQLIELLQGDLAQVSGLPVRGSSRGAAAETTSEAPPRRRAMRFSWRRRGPAGSSGKTGSTLAADGPEELLQKMEAEIVGRGERGAASLGRHAESRAKAGARRRGGEEQEWAKEEKENEAEVVESGMKLAAFAIAEIYAQRERGP